MLNLIVGLGNSGERYQKTRHNLGYEVVDRLATRNERSFQPGKGNYLFSQIEKRKGESVVLIKPLTYVNASGEAVVQAMDDFGRGIENLLVVCDDVSLPLGRIRIREKGTDGGHKGLKSVIYQLNSVLFARLRMGVGEAPEGVELEEFVLSSFEKEEEEAVHKMIETACMAVENALTWGLQDSMSRFNA